MLRVNAINRQGLLKCLTFNPKSLVFKTVSVPCHMGFWLSLINLFRFRFGFRSTFLCFIQKKVVSLPPLSSPFPLRRRDVEYSEARKLLDISVVTPILIQQAMKQDALRAHAGCPLALLYTIRR